MEIPEVRRSPCGSELSLPEHQRAQGNLRGSSTTSARRHATARYSASMET